MKKIVILKDYVCFITSFLFTCFSYLFGGWDVALQSLILVMGIDYLTGVCKGIKNKNLNSKVGGEGILKKAGYLLVVMLAVILDRLVGGTEAVRTFVIYSFVANESLSILENWGSMGLKLPKKIFELLEQLKQENETITIKEGETK